MVYLRSVLANIKKADYEYNLISDGDKIAVGISGGKDSMLLIYALNAYKKMVQKEKTFEIIGIHIKLGFPKMNPSKLKKYFKGNNIEFKVVPSNAYKILKANVANNGRLPCSICSKLKKAIMIEEAKKNNCNKIAFAHHSDDAIETFFLNAIFGGRVATFRPKMYLDRSKVTLIRPFVYVSEKEIEKYVKKLDLPLLESTCPNDKNTERENIKNLLKDIYKKYPCSRTNFLLMLHNTEKIDLWKKENK